MNFFKKISSRKFLAMIVGVFTGIATVFSLDQTVVNTVSGTVISLVSVITYIVTEGKIDASALGEAADEVKDAMEVVSEDAAE